MGISRREILTGATAITTMIASSSLSACTPAPIDHLTAPGQFFALIGRGELIRAKELLAEGASLSVVSTAGGQSFTDAQAIVELLDRLLRNEGFNMIGDDEDVALGGMYWRQIGPWLCSDMLKGDAVALGFCEQGLSGSVFNVYTDPFSVAGRLKTVLLLESHNLIAQFPDGSGPEYRNVDAMEN